MRYYQQLKNLYLSPIMTIIGVSIIVLLVCILSVYFNQGDQDRATNEFRKWKKDFSIEYSSHFEDSLRLRLFQQNLKEIEYHNLDQSKTYEMGINQFTAMTKQEFALTYLSYFDPTSQKFSDYQISIYFQFPNAQIDWSSLGAVTKPKNQGQCGASWAFACTGGLEGLGKIAYGYLKEFSQQQLLDCSGGYGNHGCTSGTIVNAYKYVKDKGICQQYQYPYKAVAQHCKNCTNPFLISGYTEVRNCNDLLQGIQDRPISVAVDASNWVNYKSGLFSNCGTNINYAALLVGVIGGVWKVKNSWGTSWGQSGYIRLVPGNTCGICSMGSYPNK